MNDKAAKLAEEILNVFKYNPELSHEERILVIELRIKNLIWDVEKDCAEAHKRAQENAVIIDNRPNDIPILAEAMINAAQARGPAN